MTYRYKITLKDMLEDTRITQGDLMSSSFWRSLSLFGTTQAAKIALQQKKRYPGYLKLHWVLGVHTMKIHDATIFEYVCSAFVFIGRVHLENGSSHLDCVDNIVCSRGIMGNLSIPLFHETKFYRVSDQ